MNKKEKLFQDIENNLDTFQFHIKKMKKPGFKVHSIDVDLLRKKTLELYDRLNAIEFELAENNLEKIINLPERMPKGELPEKTTTLLPENEPKQTIEEKEEDIKELLNNQTEKATQPKQTSEIPAKEDIDKDPTNSSTVEKQSEIEPSKDETPPIVADNQKEQKTETPSDSGNIDSTMSAFDLFSAESEATIADKLGSNDEPSIADSMQKSQVIDLRQAIGINEKFLFINELFNGDMGRYNKVIDELNGLKTQQGIKTYFFELKVANQWSEENEAFLNFKNILERKSI